MSAWPIGSGVGPGSSFDDIARPLRRSIQRELDNRLSKLLLEGTAGPGDTVRVRTKGGDLDLQVEAGSTQTDDANSAGEAPAKPAKSASKATNTVKAPAKKKKEVE